MMNGPKSEWQTKELTQTYLEGVRGAIPGACLQIAAIGKIAQQWCNNPKGIFDIGFTNVIIVRFLLDLFPSSSDLFVDCSEPMLEAARENVGTIAAATVAKADFASPLWLETVKPHGPFDIVVSGFAIHHQPDNRKKALYSEIFGLLGTGGVFLNLDHVASATEAGEDLFDCFFKVFELALFGGRKP